MRGFSGKREHKIQRVRGILIKHKVVKRETIRLCKKMASLRNEYAHGQGLKPKEDALAALNWMHCFIDNETTLMRDFVIVNGILRRKGSFGGSSGDTHLNSVDPSGWVR